MKKWLILDAGVYTVQSIQTAVESGEEIQIDDEVLMAGIESWKSALEDIGTVEGITGDRVEVTDDGYTIYINIDGTDHDAEAVMDVDKKMTTFTNIAVNVKYSKMELVQQAGLNTLLGMGVTDRRYLHVQSDSLLPGAEKEQGSRGRGRQPFDRYGSRGGDFLPPAFRRGRRSQR